MDTILKYLSGFGLHPWMEFFLVLIIILSYFYKKQIQEWLSTTIKLKKKKQHKISDLKSHDIFTTFTRVKKEVKIMRFFTDGEFDNTKTRMCQDFTNFKCDVCYEGFEELLKIDVDTLSNAALKTIMLDAMWDMHDTYIQKIKQYWLDKKIPLSDVEYVIECFERFRFDVVQAFQYRIDAIFASSYHTTKFDKFLSCYDMFAMGVDLLPKDLQTTFEALNGKFKKIKY